MKLTSIKFGLSPEYSVEEMKDLRTAFIARLVKIDLSKPKYQRLVYANYDKDISQYRKAKNLKLTQAEHPKSASISSTSMRSMSFG
ncbi:hypothetical protein LTR10_013362 [Elasticomyces elasticus]|uniref:Uncharacterized protein n=1 Tax=Exophiala sideris TaxID=1016849 RepID=A0ABR0J530_9EURO|nr:hypothetical protein LTR10_013362 [Elasticomyces elasticus]KAK5027409.1 hypothetical protein LTS07_007011 [Exophiala sideris]KAK5034889.1 hypothetical protein LTR13_006071 [Exophiala sideris]KAK5056377.1 hypothetical protein LTR69_007918 [Exophiala sideris]KAK5181134.1 hypothetical protein LTR44_006465 [Eurotiomycetes sp. CCFEE 6388]